MKIASQLVRYFFTGGTAAIVELGISILLFVSREDHTGSMAEHVTLVVFFAAAMLSFPVWFYGYWHMRRFHDAWKRDEEWRPELNKALVGMGCFVATWVVGIGSAVIAYRLGASWLQW